MKYYHRLIEELREIAENHEPGTKMKVPTLLRSVDIEGRKMSYLHLGLDLLLQLLMLPLQERRVCF